MKERIANLLTLPYRMWMLGLGYMCWCDECHTIVSGGFGFTDHGVHKFQCMDCAQKDMENRNCVAYLNEAISKDPTKEEL